MGLVLLWRTREERATALLLTGFLEFSFLGTVPGLYFRTHYFILVLPAVALLIGAAAAACPRFSIPLFAIALLFSIYQQREFFFFMKPDEASQAVWGTANSFEKAKRAGEWLRSHSRPDARVAVLGSEPEIYFYANRRAATGYLYMYPLMEPGPQAVKMQDDLIRQIEASRPEYVAFVYSNISWGRNNSSSTRVFQWWPDYRDANYSLAAWIYQRRPDAYISIYRRNP